MISGFHPGVHETLALLGRYIASIGSYRRFGTTCRSHLLNRLRRDPLGRLETSVSIYKTYVTSQKREDFNSGLLPHFINCGNVLKFDFVIVFCAVGGHFNTGTGIYYLIFQLIKMHFFLLKNDPQNYWWVFLIKSAEIPCYL